MKLIDKILNMFGIKKEWINDKASIEDTLLNVCIKDDMLATTLGQWVGLLPDSIKTGGNGHYVYSHLPANQFLREFVLSDKQREDICKRIAYLLTLAGYDVEDICLLEDFNEEDLTFKANFINGDTLECQITWGSFLDSCPQLRIKDGKEKVRYNYSASHDKNPDRLSLEIYEKELDTGNTFSHFASEYRYYGDLYNDEYRLSVEIKYSDSLKSIKKDDNIYVDEEKMQSMISSLTFPIDIQQVCKLVADSLMIEPEEIPEIKISVKKTLEDKKTTEITDKAVFKYGEFHEFAITKNDKKIVIDRFENWSIKDENHTVSGNSDVEVGFVVNKVPKNQIEHYNYPVTVVDNALLEYEETKGIALSLFKKEK